MNGFDDRLGQIVTTNGTFEIPDANAKGFSITRRSGMGRYPLVVELDGDTKNTVLVEGPGYLRASNSFTTMKVDTSLGGGQPSDEWDVRLLLTAEAKPEPRVRLSNRAAQIIAPDTAVTLFDIDSRQNLAAWAGITGGNAFEGRVFITPEAPTVFTALGVQVLDGWDVSDATHVQFVVEQYSMAGGAAWTFEPLLMAGVFTDGLAHAEYQMGTTGDFGATPGAWSGEQGMIYLGSGADDDDTHRVERIRYMPALRFAVDIGANAVPNTQFQDPSSFYIRIAARKW